MPEYSRRDPGLLIPALAAASAASAQTRTQISEEAPVDNSLEKLPRLGPGGIHNAKNVGTDRAQYFILNFGRDDV